MADAKTLSSFIFLQKKRRHGILDLSFVYGTFNRIKEQKKK